MNNEVKAIEMKASEYDANDFNSYLQLERHEMLKYIPQSAKNILDIGCAVGCFGQLLKAERCVEVWGVELNEHAASIATQKLDKVICGAFDKNLHLPSQRFDCIVFNDVLEHLVDPYNALIYAKQLLRDGGRIVASIPNIRYFDNIWKLLVEKDWKYTEHGILDRTHLRFFTRRSILSTFDTLGYCVDSIEGISPLEKAHPHQARKFRFLNLLLCNHIEDMRYLQFAVVARPRIV
ncbi:MAG: class I SAM-dependent methyltransferase [Aulosira sp. DedQUE10]|nr:class I SAM-dependent methyltransferase [Aulosira sp. DedQUE10]